METDFQGTGQVEPVNGTDIARQCASSLSWKDYIYGILYFLSTNSLYWSYMLDETTVLYEGGNNIINVLPPSRHRVFILPMDRSNRCVHVTGNSHLLPTSQLV